MRTRVGIVGLGVMGARHARVFAALADDFEVVGAFDPKDVTIQQDLRRFGDLASLVGASDLVVVASPIEAHVEGALLALDAGKHVFVEKPLAGTAREALALVERAARAERSLFVGYSERFHPVVRALIDELGEAPIRSMSFRRIATGAPRDASLRTPHADALLNLAVHDLDLAALFGGNGAALASARSNGRLATIEIASSSWRTTITAGRGAEPERTFEIVTDAATWRGDLRTASLVRVADATRSDVAPLPIEEPLLAQAAAVAARLRGDASRVAAGEEGARAVALAEEALLALEPPLRTAENL